MDWITICITDKRFANWGLGWGGGILTKVLYGEAPPQGPTSYLLYSISDRNDSPFVYFPSTNGSTPSLQLN